MQYRRPRHSAVMLSALGAAFMPCAQADGLQLSGYLDIGVYRLFDETTRVDSIQRSSLVLGGRESLGGGTQVTFRLEHRLEMGSGAVEGPGKPFFHGESTLGLAGRWGALRLGRALTALWSQDWKFDAWAFSNRIASPAWQFWHALAPSDRVADQGHPDFGRLDRGVFYDSPDIAGFSLHLSGTPARTQGPGGGRNRSVALVYARRGWRAVAAHERNGSGDTARFLAVRGSYGALTLNLAHDVSRRAGTSLQAVARTMDAAYAIGVYTFKLGYGHQTLAGTGTGFLGLGAEHRWTRRTTVYLSAGQLRPDAGPRATACGLGIAHAF